LASVHITRKVKAGEGRPACGAVQTGFGASTRIAKQPMQNMRRSEQLLAVYPKITLSPEAIEAWKAIARAFIIGQAARRSIL
jgi:hypothetical protein